MQFSVFLSFYRDAVINGYHVPKGSHIMPNLYAIHMNGHHYEQPDIFKPERFIVKDKIYMPPNYLPFSSGKYYMKNFASLTFGK